MLPPFLVSGVALSAALHKDLGRAVTNELPAQSISFGSLPATANIGDTYDSDQVTASSGLVVTVSIDPSSAGGACKLMGSTVTFTGGGNCVLDASQAGDTSLAPAMAQASVTVNTPSNANPAPAPTQTYTAPGVQAISTNAVTERTNERDRSDTNASAGELLGSSSRRVVDVVIDGIAVGSFSVGFTTGSPGLISEVIYASAARVIIARGTATTHQAAKGSVKLRLTPVGKNLLKAAARSRSKVLFSASVTFQPKVTSLKAVHATRSEQVRL